MAKRRVASQRSQRLASKRFARRQRARRWRTWRWVVAGVLVLGLVAGSVWLVLFSSVLRVDVVTVEGDELLDPMRLRRVAAVPVGEPLATVDLESIGSRVESMAPVESVDVSRTWPDGVRIAVDERTAVAALETPGGLRGVDDGGVVFRSYASPPRGLPILRVDSDAGQDALAEAALVVGTLPSDLAKKVASVDAASIDSISLRLHNGRVVLWGSADDSANKVKVLAVLLEQKASTYDVSVPGQPTIRP